MSKSKYNIRHLKYLQNKVIGSYINYTKLEKELRNYDRREFKSKIPYLESSIIDEIKNTFRRRKWLKMIKEFFEISGIFVIIGVIGLFIVTMFTQLTKFIKKILKWKL